MKTKHLFLTAIGAFAFILNASAARMSAVRIDPDHAAGIHTTGIHAPQPLAATIPAEDPAALVQKLYDYEQARIQREQAYLAHLKHDDLQMTDSMWPAKKQTNRQSPSVPVHQASE